LGNLFQHPIYYGVFYWDGVLHEGIHQPMISKETFDQIQKVRVEVGKGEYNSQSSAFRFLNFARCGSCGYSITGERHVKKSGRRYVYYRCTHKNKIMHCEDRTFVTAEKFAAEVKRNAKLISIPDIWKERFLARIENWETEEATGIRTEIIALKSALNILRAKLGQLNTGFIDGDIQLTELRELKNPLITKKLEIEAKISRLAKGGNYRLEPLRDWVISANTVGNAVLKEDWDEMKKILQKAGSNPILRSQTLHVSFLKPWNLLADFNSASSPVSSKMDETGKWWR
jgi:Recombinase zinc beta ribbon domain